MQPLEKNLKLTTMYFRTVLFCVFFIFSEIHASSRIANGTDAKEGEFPFVVSLRRNASHTCGGTILNEKYILTAAHCVCKEQGSQDASLFSIQYEMLNITKEPVNTINVKRIECNDFSASSLTHDSAVLELESSIPPGKWTPVKLSKNFDTSKKQIGVIVGWGQLYSQGPIARTLQKMDVEIFDDETCGKTFNNEHHICFGAPIGGACPGDSGTALLVDDEQVGIASFITAKCGVANEETPNVYSRVSTYYDWIASVLKQE